MTDEEFARPEIAHDTMMEDIAIYRGHSQAEVETWLDDDDWDGLHPDERPLPCPHRFTDFDADECWSGNCLLAFKELHEAIASRVLH